MTSAMHRRMTVNKISPVVAAALFTIFIVPREFTPSSSISK